MMGDPRTEQVATAREEQFLALLHAARPANPGPGLFDAASLAQDGLALRAVAPRAAIGPRRGACAWWLPNLLWQVAWRAWRFTRELSGDDAYERYLEHVARVHPGQAPMTRAEHYRFRQDEKWNRLSRCC